MWGTGCITTMKLSEVRRKPVKRPSHRYNRRHDGVLTVSSDKDRHELEEARLRKQWEKTVFESTLPSPYTPGKEAFRG